MPLLAIVDGCDEPRKIMLFRVGIAEPLLDLAVSLLAERSPPAGYPIVILDLQHVTYLDSAGIGVLAQLHLSSQRRGSRAVFVNVAGKNRELLRVTKLLTVFEVYDSTIEAERSFSPRFAALTSP